MGDTIDDAQKSGSATNQQSELTNRFPVTRQPYTVYEGMEMQLNPREASLVEAFRRLPPDTAAELSALAERLATVAPNRSIDWSDSWSDQDLNDFRAASLKRLEAEESEESR